MTPFERSLSKLSENHEIVEIGSTEFMLWQLEESPEPLQGHYPSICVAY